MGGGASMPAAYMAEEREKRKKEQDELKQTIDDNLRYLTEDLSIKNTELAERANIAKSQLEDEVVKLKAELRRAIHSETTLKKENKKLAAELEKLQTVVDNLPKTTEQLKEQRRANKALAAENEALAEQIKKYEGMEQAMRALKQKQKDMEEEMERMQRKVERAEAVQQVNKTLTLRADNLQADVDRLSSLLEKAATSEQIRKSLTQEEVRKMKVMASKVAMNDKALSRRNRELETQVAQLQKQLSVHKGYKAAAVKNKELENTIKSMDEDLKGASMRASDSMVAVLTERKDALEKEVRFLKAQVARYSEAARDRNDKARRVDELESELDHVSKPFLNLSRSVDGMNKDIEGMIGKMNSDLAVEVSTLQLQMEKAVSKVKETEELNNRVREYEALLSEQKVAMEEEASQREKDSLALEASLLAATEYEEKLAVREKDAELAELRVTLELADAAEEAAAEPGTAAEAEAAADATPAAEAVAEQVASHEAAGSADVPDGAPEAVADAAAVAAEPPPSEVEPPEEAKGKEEDLTDVVTEAAPVDDPVEVASTG